MAISLGFCCFLLVCLVVAASGSIHEYKNEVFKKYGDSDTLYFHGGYEGVFASEFLTVPASSLAPDTPPLKGKAFVRFEEISFVRSKKKNFSTRGLVEAILFEAKQEERINGSCCTKALVESGSCSLGDVVITSDVNDLEEPKKIQTFFKRGELEAKMSLEAVAINRTGFYTVYFMTCDAGLEGMVIRGRTVWKNPHGYLPGEEAPFKTFYACMFWAYALLGLVWFLGVVMNWSRRVQLHAHITLVIVLSMSEFALRYYELEGLNSTGVSPVEVSFWAVTFSSLKMCFSRLLLLVVTSGYGVVVKPIVGNIAWRMLSLGFIGFVLGEALGVAEHLGNGILFISLLLALVESCFLQWTYRNLWNTLKKLKVKKNMDKLYLYEMFATALVILTFLTIAMIFGKIHVETSGSDFWQVGWIVKASWYILAYALLLVICLFWAPSDNLIRYLYIAEMEEGVEEEGIALTKTKDGVADRRTLVDAAIIFFGGKGQRN